MTREEEIKKAVQEFIEERKTAIGRSKRGGWYFANIFEEGIKWADEHPKSSWINVKDDLPSFHSDLVENAIATKNVIVLLNDGRIRETQLLCGHWKEYDKKVTHWMPILEPPKE